MRACAFLLVISVACAKGVETPTASLAPDDSGVPDAATASEVDASVSSPVQSESEYVAPDGGVGMVVEPEAGASCAAWLPVASAPEAVTVGLGPGFDPPGWDDAITDGQGHLGVYSHYNYEDFGVWHDGAFEGSGWSDLAIPRANGFAIFSGCGFSMICFQQLENWPERTIIKLGTGYAYTTNCTLALRAAGGLYLSCSSEAQDGGVTRTFATYDDSLQPVSTPTEGDGLDLVEADEQDRVLEEDYSTFEHRWLDSSGQPVTDFFPAMQHRYGRVSRLIGGGFFYPLLNQVIPSGQLPMAAPAWLAGHARADIVLGHRAYALDGDCSLEVRDAAGTKCGTVSFPNCGGNALPGADGSIALHSAGDTNQLMNITYYVWRGILR